MSGSRRPLDRFELTADDKAQSLWRRLKAHFEDQLAAARMRNDDPGLSDADTAAIRGEIKTLKAHIRLGDDRPIISTGDDQPP